MMIFTKLRWKNFLSTGDHFTEVDFRKHQSTLIVGSNGAGKSTLLDALSYGLFGKPHRNINKPQLVNTINDKDCVVEVEFRIGKNEYKIIRGQKPGIFQIYVNGSLLPQNSTTKDYQRYLEQNILKLNHKSFHQVVVLGSSSFIPFMQLPTGQRRQVIEDLLDINIFTRMNQLLREEHSKVKEKARDTDYQIKTLENKEDIQKKYIGDLENLNEEMIREKEKDIQSYENRGVELQKNIDKLTKKIEAGRAEYRKRKDSFDAKKRAIDSKISEARSEIRQAEKAVRFFEKNDTCPTCTQDIDEDLKTEKKGIFQSEIDDEQSKIQGYDAQIGELNERVQALEEISELIRVDEDKNSDYYSEANSIFRIIKSLNKDIRNLEKKSGDIDGARQDLEKIKSDLYHYRDQRIELRDTMNYHSTMFEMLKDSGIKTKIIRQYLPVMNKLINQYLQVLDFFVSFNLDENFSEVIKSRHRDEFSYASFSEGEKQKINLALLFTWRQVAKMKNSVSTNLLILDETFDSSLDNDSIDNLLKILDTLDPDTNVFVISHKRELDNKFHNKLKFMKINNFSVYHEESV